MNLYDALKVSRICCHILFKDSCKNCPFNGYQGNACFPYLVHNRTILQEKLVIKIAHKIMNKKKLTNKILKHWNKFHKQGEA